MAAPKQYDIHVLLSHEGQVRCREQWGEAGLPFNSLAYDEMKNITGQAFRKLYTLIDTIKTRDAEETRLVARVNARLGVRNLREDFKTFLHENAGKIDLNGRNVPFKNPHHCNLLHTAAMEGLEPEMELLLDAGAPIDSLCHEGSALMLAIKHQHTAIVSRLIARGASLHADIHRSAEYTMWAIGSENTPMIEAAANGDIKMIDHLAAHGADPNELGPDGITCPLLKTLSKWNADAVRALVACGANPNQPRLFLPSAASEGSAAYITALMDSGADMINHNPNELCAMDYARKQVSFERLKLFDARYNEACQNWDDITQHVRAASQPESVLRTLKPRQVILCANIGKLNTLLDLPGWSAARGHLHHLLTQLPPWIMQQVQERRPTLLTPQKDALDWTARIAEAPTTSRQVGA